MSRLDRFGRRLALCAILFGSSVASGSGGVAAPLTLPDIPYRYTVIDQDLAAALQEFGANLGLKVSISPEVKGRIQGRIPDGTPRAFLDRLAAIYNLEWYYDGGVLFITSAKENRTQLLVLNPIGFDAFASALDALRINDSRFPLRTTRGRTSRWSRARRASSPSWSRPWPASRPRSRNARTPAIQTATPRIPSRGSVLTIYRGSGTTFIRDGRPE